MYKYHHHHRGHNRNREKERQRQEEMKMRDVALREALMQMVERTRYGFPGHGARNQDHCYRQGYRPPGWLPPRGMNAVMNSHVWEERQRPQKMEMMRELALEEAFKEKMMEGIVQSDPAHMTRIQTMRAVCEKLFSKLNQQLGKLVDQIKETDLYADIMNTEFSGRINELHHNLGTDFAAFNLENEKRNMAHGVVSNRQQSKKYIAHLQYQLAGQNNPLKLRKLKKFEDCDFIGRVQSTKKSNNPILNLVRKWDKA